MLAEFFTLRNWRLFCLYLNNQRSYGKMEGTGRFTASNWSKTNPPRFSDCRLLVLYKGMKTCGRNFWLPDRDFQMSEFGWATQPARENLDFGIASQPESQNGPEITLKGILIVVEGRFMAERNGSPIGLL